MPSFVGLLLDLALYNLKKRDFIAEYWMSENFIPAPYASLGHKNRAVFYERRQSMTNTKCSYGTSMSIFCIYNLKNHTFNERERERELLNNTLFNLTPPFSHMNTASVNGDAPSPNAAPSVVSPYRRVISFTPCQCRGWS